ncbi:sulfatase family protein [Portibacter marinus]|uniref:sulfatase family protein n=1 Tax=Portibacter marinus TaxID=2898660 RepID=UPI001F1BE064|nr:sulfatase [Portibacter marinus]
MKNAALFFIHFFILNFSSGQATIVNRPNIVICLADDWGWPHSGAYGDSVIQTPHFDRIAREGALFNHMYVSSPSCTPSRNAFLTGKHHWELGSGANLWSTLPLEHESFIHLLMDQGYASGRSKAKTWGPGNAEDWIKHHGQHPGGQAYDSISQFLETVSQDEPFVFWQGTSDPHRGYKAGSGEESGIDLSQVHMFDHFPDVETVRSDVADYYFEVQRWDSLVGSVLKNLEDRGILEETIIIMTGDHGMPFPRCKSNIYDAGVRVPFAIRWGSKINPESKINEFASFVDIAPTLLELAQIDVPSEMTGRSFASLINSKYNEDDSEPLRDHVIFGKERHVPSQEKPDMGGYPSRGYRNHKFLYIQNYEPDRWPSGTGKIGSTNYPDQWFADCDGGPTKDYIVENKDKDPYHRRSYELCFAKRPAEELYDVIKDPDQVVNLALDPAYQETLKDLRLKLNKELLKANDPRAGDPHFKGFDQYPYLGGGGGKRN